MQSVYDYGKRALDLSGATLGLLISAPVMAAAGVAIRVTMGAPMIFRQLRPGLGGRPFELMKFRTMLPPSPGEDGAGAEAARLTPVGRFLRAASIDELPSLLNVLTGDLSLVGPRPLLMRYIPRYSPTQARRHDAKPGITGWAQVHGRNAISWDKKLELDVWYVDNRSFWLDLRIIAMTVAKVLVREGISHPGEATMSEFMGTESELSD